MSDDDALSDEIVYLHGDLDLIIIEARNLPNMDFVSDHIRRCFAFFDCCRKTSRDGNEKVRAHRKLITSDPYISVCLAGATVARTRVISNSQNPKWNERFKIQLAHPVSQVEFQVKDNDVFGADLIGTATISAERIKSGKAISDWFPILSFNGKPLKRDAAIRMEMIFLPCDENPLYNCFIADLDKHGVQNSYFPVRRGGALTLYQDAHVKDGSLPNIKLDSDVNFRHDKCWEDICHSILEAHHMIYICGWSIYHKVKLVREPSKSLPNGGDLSLGDLLKYKSQEGVRVLLLVWDDLTSHSKFFINTDGVMKTHDEETRKFFKHSSVVCVLSPRYASSKLSFFKQKVVGTLYTHHQKCVIVDTQARGNFRRVTAFLGGLDLCDGRYDTTEHRLFRDLDTIFKDDYHNPTFPVGLNGPRQPWHDLHCKIEGPAAYDVLTNFEQRWRKATKWHEDALIKLERISWILSPSASIAHDHHVLWASKEDDHETWHVQVFRSIDSGSVKGFPNKVHTAEAQNLGCAKNIVVDKSIQTAYIKAIRSAQQFIYIENQYFIGSSFAWPSYKDAGADNLVPVELALKIASKIRANERFAVYVVIPMWPEGVPSGVAFQQMLYWQGQTMQMMYEIISLELQSNNLDNSHPEDYLNFYCLGNREELPEDVSSYSGGVIDSRKFQRFMIYVHSKGMIIDDEYVIIGSANINQRSMSGSRDTEIAMGAYQPHHTWAKKRKHPRAQIYGYRMSLWAEHTGTIEDCFDEPHSLECVKRINKIAEDNWDRYTSDDYTPLQGHLLKYPVEVDISGKLKPLPGHETFPDVGGKVLGSLTSLPDVLTT